MERNIGSQNNKYIFFRVNGFYNFQLHIFKRLSNKFKIYLLLSYWRNCLEPNYCSLKI